MANDLSPLHERWRELARLIVSEQDEEKQQEWLNLGREETNSTLVENIGANNTVFTLWRRTPLLQRWINQRQICFRIKPLVHCYRVDRQHYFQRWGYVRSEKMARTRNRAVTERIVGCEAQWAQIWAQSRKWRTKY